MQANLGHKYHRSARIACSTDSQATLAHFAKKVELAWGALLTMAIEFLLSWLLVVRFDLDHQVLGRNRYLP